MQNDLDFNIEVDKKFENVKEIKQENCNEECDTPNTSSPTQAVLRGANVKELYSPVFSQFTPEEHASVDVVWDWYSPQSRPRFQRRKQIVQEETFRILPSNKLVVFDKLNEELRSLTDGLHKCKNSESNNESHIKSAKTENFESVFNDSLDEQLLVCSQKIEETLASNNTYKTSSQQVNIIDNFESPKSRLPKFQRTDGSKLIPVRGDPFLLRSNSESQITSKNNFVNKPKRADDSLDLIFETFKDEDLEIALKKSFGNKNEMNKEIHKQKTICTAEEIEEKRKEAIKKLKMRQKSSEKKSPPKCSSDEIEKKRLQALAKLEAKRNQDIIEKNRQEALRRLEMNKKKRIQQCSSMKLKSVK